MASRTIEDMEETDEVRAPHKAFNTQLLERIEKKYGSVETFLEILDFPLAGFTEEELRFYLKKPDLRLRDIVPFHLYVISMRLAWNIGDMLICFGTFHAGKCDPHPGAKGSCL